MGMEISEERANKQLMNDQAYSFELKIGMQKTELWREQK
jgi:hypothetical protein